MVKYSFEDYPEHWPVLESRVLAEGGITAFREDLVRMVDGTKARRQYTTHHGAVAVIALDDQDRMLTLRQYRHPVRLLMWELPAGLLDQPGEHPLEAAKRELFEEAYLVADDWRVLADYRNSAGTSDEASRVFVARGVREATGERFVREAEEAGIVAQWVPLAEMFEHVLAGEITTSSIVVGVSALTAALARPGGIDALRPADAPWSARPF
ncbi:NUDIX hydrolase [Actinospica durhamensis]|uniref:NUDIX hydrolase n=1 Tax=Actinospica durhamensis TaxID=1508375 RepID=A0A941IS18_9ACTN|nr:NUDIX hydrolase [Actinospica durhamensis]MBR7837989.1 NUDIX hydrolase [Actinospica durhamensis]